MNNTFEENIDYYFDNNGLMVLTEKYHLERGACCGNGCLHCPYHYEAVPEHRREFYLQRRHEKLNIQ